MNRATPGAAARACPATVAAATVAAVVVASLLALVLASCGPAHPGVAGPAAPCYQAIPIARAELHDSDADLAGVHRVALDNVRARLTNLAQSEPARHDDTAVCAIAFAGTFTPGQVDLAPPH
ncbi:MAG: hypothetical protein ACRDYY_02560 [Acidimicrobiales bacterium]